MTKGWNNADGKCQHEERVIEDGSKFKKETNRAGKERSTDENKPVDVHSPMEAHGMTSTCFAVRLHPLTCLRLGKSLAGTLHRSGILVWMHLIVRRMYTPAARKSERVTLQDEVLWVRSSHVRQDEICC